MEQKHKLLARNLLIGFLVGLAVVVTTTRIAAQELSVNSFHEHANFALFINGEQFDFSGDQFMHIKPCISSSNWLIPTTLAHGGEIQPDNTEDPSEYIHLHDNNGNTIHVHKAGMEYDDFFYGLRMELTDDSFTDQAGNSYDNNTQNTWRFFLNNQEVDSIIHEEVRNLDRVLITYGPVNRTQSEINTELIKVPNNACIESNACTHRGTPDTESCGVSGTPLILRLMGIDKTSY